MRPIRAPNKLQARGERIRRCYVSRIFHFWEGRNAYHGAPSRIYPLGYSFSHSQRTIRHRIERERKQGSHFTVVEIPCLVVQSDSASLVIADPNSAEPFKLLQGLIVSEALLGSVLAQLLQRSSRLLLWSAKVSPQAIGSQPFKREFSQPGITLGWHRGVHRPRLRSVNLLARKIAEATKREG